MIPLIVALWEQKDFGGRRRVIAADESNLSLQGFDKVTSAVGVHLFCWIGRMSRLGVAALLTCFLGANCAALVAAEQQQTPCPPGTVRVGGHQLLKPTSLPGEPPNPPAVFVGGTCVGASNFKGANFDLFPSFQLLTILYAPPGNQSEAKYGSGSSIGSKDEWKNTFKAGLVIHAETSFTETDIEALQGTINGSAVEFTKEQSTVFSVNSQTDSNSADNDLFYIWVNPEVQVIQTSPTTLTTVFTTPNGAPMIVVPVSAGELRDPSQMPAYKKTQLAALTDQDRKNLLALDPRVPGQKLDPGRFQKVNSSLQLDGPAVKDGSIPGEGVTVSNEALNTQTGGHVDELSVSVLVGGEVSWGVVSKFMAGLKVDNEYETTHEASTGTRQEAELTLKTSTVGYHDVVDVYFDTLFNSFAFISDKQLHRELLENLSGIVLDPTGRPAANKRITIRLADGSVRTLFTDSQGSYKAFNLPAGSADVSVGDQKAQIAITPSKPQVLQFKLHVAAGPTRRPQR